MKGVHLITACGPPRTDCQDQKKKKKRFNVVSNDKVVMGGFPGRLYITCKL